MVKQKQPLPQRVANVDITQHDLDTSDGFLWSLVDGVQTLRELRLITGFDEEEIILRLNRLRRLGVISWDEKSGKPPVSVVPPPAALSQRPPPALSVPPSSSFESVPTGPRQALDDSDTEPPASA